MRTLLIVLAVAGIAAAGCGRFGGSGETPEQAAARKKREEERRRREEEHRAIGVELALELAKTAREAFGAGKKEIDAAEFDRFRTDGNVVEAMVIRTEEGRMYLAGSAHAEQPPRIRKIGEPLKIAGEVVFSKGKLVSGSEETPVWVFEVRLNGEAGQRLGQAMVFLKPPKK